MIKRNLFLFLTTFLLLASAVLAQGGIKGKVRNVKGSGIAGATVIARLNGEEVKTVRSDAKGVFLMEGLRAGTYSLLVQADGYSSGVKQGIQITDGNVRDLGDRLILSVDQGNQVIIKGSVFFKEGTSVTAAKVDIERINDDGSTKKIGTAMTNVSGEFTFRPPPGTTKVRVTARYKGAEGSKEIAEIVNAGIYRTAITLDISRADK